MPASAPHAPRTRTGPATPGSTPADPARPAHGCGFGGEEPGAAALLSTNPVPLNIGSRPITHMGGGVATAPLGGWRGVFRQAPWLWGLLSGSSEEVRNTAQLESLRSWGPSDRCGWLGDPRRTCSFTLLSGCLWAALKGGGTHSWGSPQPVGARSQQVNVPVSHPSGDGSRRPGVWVYTGFSSPSTSALPTPPCSPRWGSYKTSYLSLCPCSSSSVKLSTMPGDTAALRPS